MMSSRPIALTTGLTSLILTLAVVATSGPAWASPQDLHRSSMRALGKRKPMPKPETVQVPPRANGRILVKFMDATDLRIGSSGRAVTSASQANVQGIQAIIDQHQLTVRRAFSMDDNELIALEQMAAQRSGQPQPCLSCLVYLDGAAGSLPQILAQLLQSPDVEWALAEAEKDMKPDTMAADALVDLGPSINIPAPQGGVAAGGTGACCIVDPDDGSVECLVLNSAICGLTGGTYQGDGTTCSPDPCAEDGACCVGSVCSTGTEDACTGMGGIYQGDGTDCFSNPCGNLGACCLDEMCSTVTNFKEGTQCIAAGGEWLQISDCATPGLCTVGACCYPDGCDVISMVGCLQSGGDWDGTFVTCMPAPCEGICCVADMCMEGIDNETACLNLNGIYSQVLGNSCEEIDTSCCRIDCDLDCGEEFAGDCFDDLNENAFCDDDVCCETVCEIDPWCCMPDVGGTWDLQCVRIANCFCEGGDRCKCVPQNACFSIGDTPGCDDELCCDMVCSDPLFAHCCDPEGAGWIAECADRAAEICSATPGAGTGDFVAFQGYLTDGEYPFDPTSYGYLPLAGTGYVPGFDGTGWRIFDPADPESGVHGIGEALFNLGINEYDPAFGGMSRGDTIKIGLLDFSINENHEDLAGLVMEPGQEGLLITNPELVDVDHGTACMGIMGARENGFGVTGIAPDAEMWFFPLANLEDGNREMSAWASAAQLLGPGDVLVAPYVTGGIPLLNANTYPPTHLMAEFASNLGITVVIQAGDLCQDMEVLTAELGDSGATVVSGCSPGFPGGCAQPYRWFFSGWAEGSELIDSVSLRVERNNQPHVRAWAAYVTTTGYSSNWLEPQTGDPNANYTHSFGGTSAAASQIAGLAACLQGLCKQFYGIPMSPRQIRAALNQFVVPPPAGTRECLDGGFNADIGCALDFDPEAGPHWAGNYPYAAGPSNPSTGLSSSVSMILTDNSIGFNDTPWLGSPTVIRGSKLAGNRFSISRDDGTYFTVLSEPTTAGVDGPNMPDSGNSLNNPLAGPIGQINYVATGQITDIILSSDTDTSITPLSGLRVTVTGRGNQTFQPLFMELYNWTSQTWDFLDFEVGFGQGGVVDEDTNVPGNVFVEAGTVFAGRYFEPDSNQILLRCWTFGFGGSIGNVPGQNIGAENIAYYDFIDFDITSGVNFLPGDPPG